MLSISLQPLLCTLEQLPEALEDGNACNMDNLHFQKAFDSVPSNGLLNPKTAGTLDGTLGKNEKLAREQNKMLKMKQNGKYIEGRGYFQRAQRMLP